MITNVVLIFHLSSFIFHPFMEFRHMITNVVFIFHPSSV